MRCLRKACGCSPRLPLSAVHYRLATGQGAEKSTHRSGVDSPVGAVSAAGPTTPRSSALHQHGVVVRTVGQERTFGRPQKFALFPDVFRTIPRSSDPTTSSSGLKSLHARGLSVEARSVCGSTTGFPHFPQPRWGMSSGPSGEAGSPSPEAEPRGEFVSEELRDDCARFLQELRALVGRRTAPPPGGAAWVRACPGDRAGRLTEEGQREATEPPPPNSRSAHSGQ
jgi:hypothetical protein